MEPEVSQNNELSTQPPVSNVGPEKPKHKYLPVLLTVLVMLFVLAAVGVGIWYYMDQQAKKTANDNATQVAALQKQIDDLNKKTTVTTNSTTTSGTTTATDWHTYKNTDYGFALTFPESWKGYKAVKRDPISKYALASYEFQLHSAIWNQDSPLMGVAVYTSQQFSNEQAAVAQAGGPDMQGTVIRSTSKYVYYYFHPQQYPDDLATQAKEVQSILDTFTLTN